MSTKPEIILRLESLKPRLEARAGVLAAIREFFSGRGFLETGTPVLISAPAPEEYIESPSSGVAFLRSSPELEMKCMVSAGYKRIFQLGSCFRAGEYGSRHRPEFTMLEWYEAGVDYMSLAAFTREMLIHLCRRLHGGTSLSFRGAEVLIDGEWEMISVREAYLKYAGMSMEEALAGDVFDELMVCRIEPRLGNGRPSILYDYPAERASLSRLKAGDSALAERWELYIGGLELANAYSELIDPEVQEQRFRQAAAKRREQGGADYPWPGEFFEVLRHGLPECAGCALGVDRLVMVMTDAADIGEVLFPCRA